ncbi:MAG: cytidine deaminase [Bacteroidetes bacterium OLB12]|nr:MAG: cytidine deaminase [Bacteroidetes bacterium OLB12]HNR73230.1 cytidine deaminase [Cyclobacteriaceae bacterium]HNU41104.1 cytidine deaminase [Cyclobacteriaceae bacterium]
MTTDMKGYETFKNLEELDNESKYLVHKAKEAAHHAYAPYSKFHVGAALMLEDGTVVTGSNQENASYPLCMCAERVALYTAASQHQGKRITKMAVVAHKKNHKELSAASSCGACRQVMAEFEERQHKPFEVIMHHTDSQWIKCASASLLLPLVFSGKSLND